MLRRIPVLIPVLALYGAASIAAGQPAPRSAPTGQAAAKTLPGPPAGFRALPMSPSTAGMKAAGIADGIDAEKPNEKWPNCLEDPKVHFSYSWTALAGAGSSVEMMAKAPEEPATQTGGSRNEPAGKKAYKGGVLAWRKMTNIVVGSSPNCSEMVTYSGRWTGYVSGKLIAVVVTGLYQSKDAGQAWIEDYVEKMIAVAKAL